MEFTSTDCRYSCLVWRLINQVIIFQILSLHFLVLSFDRYSRDDVIGEVNVPIEELDIGSVTPLMLMKEITPRCSKVNNYPAMNQFSDNILSWSWQSKDLESFLSLSVTNQDQEESLWWFWRPEIFPRWTLLDSQVPHAILLNTKLSAFQTHMSRYTFYTTISDLLRRKHTSRRELSTLYSMRHFFLIFQIQMEDCHPPSWSLWCWTGTG